jgi:hypothetical protein
MRWLVLVGVLGAAFAWPPRAAEAQAFGTAAVPLYGPAPRVYAPPGLYGMMYGYPGYGYPRTYTEFASPYGAGYGYGYPPYTIWNGRYGVGLWRPGFVAPGYTYGASYYRTFTVPYGSLSAGYSPQVGVYAPYFGPGYFGW